MLQEVPNVRQLPGEDRRRWFSDEKMDLTVWLDDRDAITGFELCYDKGKKERALRWNREAGFIHERVDDGEGRPGRYKGTPILLPDGVLPADRLSRLFRENCRDIDDQVADFVSQKLLSYPSSPR